MSMQLGLVLLFLAAAIAMFVLNKPRMDVVALLMLTLLPFTGVLTMGEALAGFSDANIVLIAALFVIGDGLVRTGVAQRLGDWLTTKAGSSETKLIVMLMAVVCGLGATMSSTAVTAIFIPVVLRIAQRTGAAPGRLMMPLSFAALISGMTTLVATAPNLVVSSELERSGHAGFSFFSFTPFGLPILVLGILYMLVARRWLAADNDRPKEESGRKRLGDWIEEYELAGREHRVRVSDHSLLIGKTIAELRQGESARAALVAIERGGKLLQPTPRTELRAGDILLVDLAAPPDEVDALREKFGLEQLPLSGAYFSDLSQELGMAEFILPPSSDLLGQTLTETHFADRFGVHVIGLRRGMTGRAGRLADERLRVGDTLLVIGPWRAIRHDQADRQNLAVLNLPAELDEVLPAPGKAVQAIICLLIVVGLMISGWIPNVQAALIGCLLMLALGCVDVVSAYRAIDWKTIVLIVGMLPFSLALQRTGGVDLMADGLTAVVGGAGSRVVLGSLFLITMLLGLFISNTATAVLMAPVALAIAKDLGASPYPFAMIVALAASTAFMTPISSPVNTLVVTPGRYTFGDFVRIGVPFSIVVLIVCVLLVPWLLPP